MSHLPTSYLMWLWTCGFDVEEMTSVTGLSSGYWIVVDGERERSPVLLLA